MKVGIDSMMKFSGKLAVSVSMLLALSCTKGPELSGNGGNGGGSVSVNLELSDFSELNKGNAEINSHAGEWDRSSLKMDYRSYIELGAENNVYYPTYTRLTTLDDGSYILTWQDAVGVNGNGENTYYALSRDLRTWTYMGYLWQHEDVYNGLGKPDVRRFTNANTLQLSNGEILAVAAFSTVNTYGNQNFTDEQGLVVKRSNDGGYTWFGETEIYHGPCWEAHLMELPSGEIQCFFSESRPWISSSHSGTDMVRSLDGGATWEPALGSSAYRVMRKHWWNEQKNMWCYTYQMPVGIILNDSEQFAFAMESCNQRVQNSSGGYNDQFSVAIVFSNEDGTWTYLEGDEITPRSQRIDSVVTRGAAPYLVQFPSGETLLAYGGTDSHQHFRMGNATATEWGQTDLAALPEIGSWGGLNLTSSHQVISCMRNSRDGSDNAKISIARFNLNHSITATQRTVETDGDASDWADTDEALFVGSRCQAQATLRCSADSDCIYFLIEAKDESLSSTDFAYLLLSPDNGTGNLSAKSRRIRIGYNNIKSTDQYAGGWTEYDFGVTGTVLYDGTPTDREDTDNGFRAEIAIPRSSVEVNEGRILVNFGYFDAASNLEDVLYDAGTTESWLSITVD